MSRNNKSTKTDPAMNNKGRKLIAQIKNTDKKAPVEQSKPRKSAKKEKVVLLPSSIEIGPLQPLPGFTGWLSLKIEIGNRILQLAKLRTETDNTLTNYENPLFKGALGEAIEKLEEYKSAVTDESLTDQERTAAYEKAMGITAEGEKAKALTIRQDCLTAIEGYLESEAQEQRYTAAMGALDSLLYESGKPWVNTDDFEALTTELMNFLFIPEIGARFYENTKFKPEDVAKHMGRLSAFFRELQKDEAVADIERYAITENPYRFDFTALHWRRWDYEKMAAKNRAAFQVDAEYDSKDF